MKVLIIGGGGREHALAWKLAQDAEVHVAPGNPGIEQVATCHSVGVMEFEGIKTLCADLSIDLVVVGPEDPLIAGLADVLRLEGYLVYGPSASGARMEGSKAFSKGVMAAAGVPTARFQNFTDPHPAKLFAAELFSSGNGAVIKASGAALGKGVVVAVSFEEAEETIDAMLVDREYGEAGSEIVVEERLSGREFSLLTMASPKGFTSLPVAQDYKRALDGDRGPNTGGMGTYSPVPWVSQSLVKATENEVVRPTLDALGNYRGTLFSGIMADEGGGKCLEFNVRFGDPETQTVMRRLGSGFLDALVAVARGETPEEVEVLPCAVVTVVIASGGYPGAVQKGVPITVGELPEGGMLFHAGTAWRGGQLVTNGGRVFGASGLAATLAEARNIAYAVVDQVKFEGMYVRKDIAQVTQ